jgi:hypothetical protein
MNSRFKIHVLQYSVAVTLLTVWALPQLGAAPTVPDFFPEEVAPLLERYCVKCHGPKKVKAELRIDRLNPNLMESPDAEHWEEVLNQLNTGDMPPEDELQPTPGEREIITTWVSEQLRHAAEIRRSTGGRNVLRRLTRYEYNNTLRDLLGIDYDFAKDLPPEGTAAEGFKNNSAVLGTSSLHLEYFQRIATEALRKALMPGDRPEPTVLVIQPEKHVFVPKPVKETNSKKRKKKEKNPGPVYLSNVVVEESLAILPSPKAGNPSDKRGRNATSRGSEIRVDLDFLPLEGPIRITVRAAARTQDTPGPARLEMALGYDGGNSAQPFRQLAAVDLSSPNLADLVFDARAEDFPLRTPSARQKQFFTLRNSFDRGTSDAANDKGPELVIDSFRIEAPYYSEWPPENRTRILFPSESRDDEPRYAREVLTRFMNRAYRRPATTSEIDRMHGLYRTLSDRGTKFEEAMISTLSAVLSSPGFLLISEPVPTGGHAEQARPLNDHELASRLSYFLWSSMPDEHLSDLATKGRLRDEHTLAKQVTRMLEDPRAEAFHQNFAAQWFDLDGIHSVAINPEFFPTFKESMKDVMNAETTAFLAHLIREDRTCLELIDSDYAMLNAKLARHYGIRGVAGDSLRPVTLADASQRGGVLTHASILTRNSSGDDTHPIRRGVWLLERLLNDPPPPPPPAVPTLAESENSTERLSLKARLEAHRQEDACMSCHRKIDPWGVAFENYDGIGRWRESAAGSKPMLEERVDPLFAPGAPTASSDKDAAFPKQPVLPAPRAALAANASREATDLIQAINESLNSLQRPYNHLRRLGAEGPIDQLQRFLRYIEIRTPAVELAVQKYLLGTDDNRKSFMATFQHDNRLVLAANQELRTKAEAIVAMAAPAPKAKNRKRAKAKSPRNNPPMVGIVDPRTMLADGTKISNLADLKRYLLDEKQDEFTETVVRKTLAYALGRYLEFTDTDAVKAIHSRFAANDYRMRRLITSIVLSEPFLTK